MASQSSVVNFALTILGESNRIVTIDDDTKPAREAKALWDIARDAAQAAHNWNFAMARVQLNALTDVPPFGYGYKYAIPNTALRLVQIGDIWPGVDLTDYRGSNTSEFTLEEGCILTDMGAPLNLRYIKRVEDVGKFDALFNMTLSCKLAELLAEPLTQSSTKRNDARIQFERSLSDAIRANAIQLPPQKLADDEWLMCRL